MNTRRQVHDYFYSTHIWVGKTAQFVKCLLCKPEDLLNPQNLCSKKSDLKICGYNSSSGEVHMNSCLGLTGTSPAYLSSSRQVKALSQRKLLKGRQPLRNDNQQCPLAFICTHICTWFHIHVQPHENACASIYTQIFDHSNNKR